MTHPASSDDRLHAATVARLRSEIHDRLDPIVPDADRFALLDFPDHDNIGDSAIWVGVVAYLDRRGLRPTYLSKTDTFDEEILKADIGDGPILMHGGGNFGDLWPWFHQFRERILQRFVGRPIIQLPQSIHFDDMEKADQTARLIERHGAFTLFVRDRESLDFARRKFSCETILCPDMAFAMDQPRKRPKPAHQLLLHLRNDKEAKGDRTQAHLPSGPGVVRSDWPNEDTSFRRHNQARALFEGVFRGRGIRRQQIIEHSYRQRAQSRFDRGADLLCSADYVLTDRLHGHIMSLILGITHVVLDNSYGKNSRFISAWNTCDGRDAYLASSIDDATHHLDHMQAGG